MLFLQRSHRSLFERKRHESRVEVQQRSDWPIPTLQDLNQRRLHQQGISKPPPKTLFSTTRKNGRRAVAREWTPLSVRLLRDHFTLDNDSELDSVTQPLLSKAD